MERWKYAVISEGRVVGIEPSVGLLVGGGSGGGRMRRGV